MTVTVRSCPECGRELDQTPGFVTWCPHCEWGLDTSAGREGRWARHRRLRYAGLAASARSGRRAPLRLAAGILLCLLVPLVPLALLVGGISLVVGNLDEPGIIALGIVLVLLAVVFRPRLPSVEGEELPTTAGSPLTDAVSTVAARLGRPQPDVVHALPATPTGVTTTSSTGRRVLHLNAPVWAMLSAQGRAALVTRALARETRPSRAAQVLADLAFTTVTHWLSLTGPETITPYEEVEGTVGKLDPAVYYQHVEGFSKARRQRWSNVFSRVSEKLIGAVLRGQLRLLTRLLLPAWHAGDYAADAVAADATSSAAMEEVLRAELLVESALRVAARPLGPGAADTVGSGPGTGTPRLLAVRDQLARTPQTEFERLRRLDAARVARTPSLAAPTSWRAEQLAAADGAGHQQTAGAGHQQTAGARSARAVGAGRDPQVERRLEHLLQPRWSGRDEPRRRNDTAYPCRNGRCGV